MIFASQNETIGEVYTKLVKNNILSVPIYSDEARLVGFVDILDILHFLSNKIVDYSKGTCDNFDIYFIIFDFFIDFSVIL